MSTLQCPATLLLVRAGDPDRLATALTGRRVARVWTGTDDAAARTAVELAARLGVGVTTDAVLDADAGAALDTVADAHPGETVLLLVPPAVLAQVPRVCRTTTAPCGPVDPDSVVEVLADADDRVWRLFD